MKHLKNEQNMGEFWHTMQRSNFQITVIEEALYLSEGMENLFSNMIEEKFSNLVNRYPYRYKGPTKHQTDKSRNSQRHIIAKTSIKCNENHKRENSSHL